MFFLLGAMLWNAYLGWQWKRTRTIPEELKELRKQQSPKDEQGNRPPSKVDGRIAALEEVSAFTFVFTPSSFQTMGVAWSDYGLCCAATKAHVKEGVQGCASQLGWSDHGSRHSNSCGGAYQHISSCRHDWLRLLLQNCAYAIQISFALSFGCEAEQHFMQITVHNAKPKVGSRVLDSSCSSSSQCKLQLDLGIPQQYV